MFCQRRSWLTAGGSATRSSQRPPTQGGEHMRISIGGLALLVIIVIIILIFFV